MLPHRFLILLVPLAAASAGKAAIIGFTGPVEFIPPPPFVSPLTDYASIPRDVTVWDEQQGVVLSNVAVDMMNNPGDTSAPVPGLLSGVVDSHFVQQVRIGQTITSGTILFDLPIVGVVYDWTNLNNSDALVAPPGTTYDTALPRGIDPLYDYIDITGNLLTFDIYHYGAPSTDSIQFRVFTAIPTPASALPFGLCGVLQARRRRANAPA